MEHRAEYNLEHDLTNQMYLNLAFAVVVQASKDYVKARKRNEYGNIKSIEKFFNSEWFDTLTMDKLNGEVLMDKLKGQVRV